MVLVFPASQSYKSEINTFLEWNILPFNSNLKAFRRELAGRVEKSEIYFNSTFFCVHRILLRFLLPFLRPHFACHAAHWKCTSNEWISERATGKNEWSRQNKNFSERMAHEERWEGEHGEFMYVRILSEASGGWKWNGTITRNMSFARGKLRVCRDEFLNYVRRSSNKSVSLPWRELTFSPVIVTTGSPQCGTRFQSLLFTLLGPALASAELLRRTFSTRFQILSLTVFCAIHGHQYLQLIKCSSVVWCVHIFIPFECFLPQFDRSDAIFGLSWSQSKWWCSKWPKCGWISKRRNFFFNMQRKQII